MTAVAAKGPVIPAIRSTQSAQERTALLGMTIFIASWAMLFAGLFFAYGAIRLRTPAWPPFDLPRIPRDLPTIATILIASSSIALERALGQIRRQTPRIHVWPKIASALVAGGGFLALQIVSWRALYLEGLRPNTGTYASVFYGLTVFHALHVAVGLVALAYLTVATAVTEPRSRYLSLRLWTIYWHMVGIIWGVMFLLVYLL